MKGTCGMMLRALLCALLCACGGETTNRLATTQVTLRIDVADELRASADELRAALYVKEPSRWRPGSTLRIDLAGRTFPVDVPVLPRFAEDADRQFEVVLELAREGAVLARDRVVAEFRRDVVTVVPVTIAACAPSVACDGDDCHGPMCRECRVASCEPVGVSASEADITVARDAEVPGDGASDAGVDGMTKGDAAGTANDPHDAAVGDAAVARPPVDGDAGSAPNDAGTANPPADAGDAASGPSASCPAANACASGYACVPTAAGYTCRGQRADWPMPDGVEGAKFAQRYKAQAETVLDEVTALEWQIGIPSVYPGCTDRSRAANGVLGPYGEFCTREEARSYCEKLTRGGHDDWRAPSLIELVSLFDMRAEPDWANAIDGDFFGDSMRYDFIADSPTASGPTSGWVVSYEYRVIYRDRNVSGRVRCVRGGAEPSFATPADRFVVEGDTVRDRATMLVWQRAPSTMRLAGAAVDQHCAALGNGFRAPTPNELMTLVDTTRDSPAIDTAVFPATPAAEFATTAKIVMERYVNFATGEFVQRASDGFVRCVR